MTQQMRRAAVSIVCNVAESQGRSSRSEMRQFILIARGSALELEAQIVIATDLEFIDEARSQEVIALAVEVIRLLNGFLGYIARSSK